MKIRKLQDRMAEILLAFSLLLVIGAASSAAVQAQNRGDHNWDQYGNYGGSPQLRQTALSAGFDEGVAYRGHVNQQGRTQPDYRDSDVYRTATKDYYSRLGDRELYRRYFREAFESGYNAGDYGQVDRVGDDRYSNRDRNGRQGRRGRNLDGYGNYGGSFQLRQTALNAGFSEGAKQGRKDRNKRYDSGFQNQSVYQKGTKDYSSRLGDRDIYRRYFREAYEHGYADGIGGY